MRNLLKPRNPAALAALLLAACQAAPPAYEVVLKADRVRADSPFLATRVAEMLDRNRDRVLELVKHGRTPNQPSSSAPLY